MSESSEIMSLSRWSQFRDGLGPIGLAPLLLLGGLGIAQSFDSGAFGVLAPEIRHTFHLNNAGIDSVAALTGALPLLGSVFIGNLGDRGDRIRITRNSGILWGVTAILTGVAPILAIFVIARLLGGIGLLSSQTIYPSLLSDYYPLGKRAQVLTVYLVATTGVGLAATPLAGLLGDAFGWRPTFVLLALPTFVFVVLLKMLHDPTRRPATATAADGAAVVVDAESAPLAPTVGNMRESFRIIRKARSLRRVWMGAFILGGAAAPLATLVSTFFKDVFHVGATGRGGIVSAVGVGALLGLVLAGGLAQRMVAAGRTRVLPLISGGGAAVFAVFVLVLSLTPTLWMAVVVAALAGVGLGAFLPPYTTVVSLVTEPHLRSQAFAWSTVFFALGAILVAVFVGALADAAGQRTALGSLSVVIVTGGLVLASAHRYVDADLTESTPAPK
jgi:MFS family permease